MTQNVLNYMKNAEDKRHNAAQELETIRSNTEREAETKRHNLAMELETRRANIESEGLKGKEIDVKKQEAKTKQQEADIKEKGFQLEKRNTDRLNWIFENFPDLFTSGEQAKIEEAVAKATSAEVAAQEAKDTKKGKDTYSQTKGMQTTRYDAEGKEKPTGTKPSTGSKTHTANNTKHGGGGSTFGDSNAYYTEQAATSLDAAKAQMIASMASIDEKKANALSKRLSGAKDAAQALAIFQSFILNG